MTSPPLPLILDCDPGVDDAVALLLALASPELRLLAVTTTHGNVSLERTTRNALDLLAFAGDAGTRVYAGAAAPLVRSPVYAPEIHGQGGLGGVTLPHSGRQAGPLHAALALVRLADDLPGELTVCATGPLTNLALAERLAPGFLAGLKELLIMGGSVDTAAPRLGNVTPWAEFNTYADPHALRIVLESGANIRLFGLNLTRQVRVTRESTVALAALNTPSARLCADILNDYLAMIEKRGQQVGALHDPCTVAALIRPDLFESEAARITISLDENARLGLTERVDGAPNVQLVTRADEDGIWELLRERLG